MTLEAARQLVLDEGLGEHGIVVLTRMGDDPGPERMDGVVRALRVLYEHLDGAEVIERQLAHALFGLANQVAANIGSWAEKGLEWRERLVDYELPALLIGIESVVSGDPAE